VSGVRVRFTFNQQEFRQMTQSGLIDQSVARAAGHVRDEAKKEITAQGRVDTGKMRQSGRTQKVTRGGGSWYEVEFPGDVSWYQHEGTRDHGPRRARILRFKPKGSGVFVFAHRVRGVTASKFLTKALLRLRPGDFHP
jgi:hypothetical protein